MSWALILTWLVVVIGVGAGAALIVLFVRNPTRYITKIRTNAITVITLLGLSSLMLSWFAADHELIEKAAFIVGTGVATRSLALCLELANMFVPQAQNKIATRMDINMVYTFSWAIAVMFALAAFVGVVQFEDHAIEQVFIVILIAGFKVGDVYIRKDEDHMVTENG